MKTKFYLFITLLIFIGCSDENSNNSILKKGINGKNKVITYTYNPVNPSNPYDSIGYWHNLALDEFLSHKESLTCDSSNIVSTMKTVYSDFFVTNPNYLPSGFSESDCDSIIDQSMSTISTMLPSAIIEEYSYNDTAHSELDDLIDLFRNYSDSTSPAQLINSIKSWENSVLNSNYSTELQEQLLKTSAIGRWSLAYWWDVKNDPNNLWWGIIDCGAGIIFKNNDDKIALSDDVQGAIAMAASDAIGFIGAGPVGAVTASTATGIYWYCGKQILNGLEAAWNWLINLF